MISNPENAPAELLPPGCRFLDVDEIQPGSPVIDGVMVWIPHPQSFWGRWSGSERDKTYCTSLSRRGLKEARRLGEIKRLYDRNPLMLEVPCKCGCGQIIKPRTPYKARSYADKTHANRSHPPESVRKGLAHPNRAGKPDDHGKADLSVKPLWPKGPKDRTQPSRIRK